MSRFVLFLCLSAATFASAAVPAEMVGFRQTELADTAGDRPLHVSIWYPTAADGAAVAVGENPVFFGAPAIKDAEPVDQAHPLVVLSHGYGGSWRNLSWLADDLARHGYVVAAPDHPGTTTFDRSPAQAARLWERPRDLSRVIDALVGNPSLAGPIAPDRIAAIGHSLGGWTVAALGGARLSVDRFIQDCKTAVSPRACALAAELGIVPDNKAALEADLGDSRVGAVVTLDLGLARGLTPESLGALRVPFLVIGAGVDIGGLPSKLESGYLAAGLPQATTRYVDIPDAMHFSFMQPCKPGAIALIEADTPGDGIVCRDGGTRDRREIHRQVAGMIVAFLAKSIPAK